MTLPPCPIAGHENPHHWHGTRCYSAHVPEPTPDPDEWVRVPVGTRIPAGTLLREEWPSVGFTANEDATVQIRRSDLDAILKPAPTPAEKLAEALSATSGSAYDTWTPADVLAALDAAGLTLTERGEK